MVVLLEGSSISTEEFLELCQSDHRVLSHLPDQSPSTPIAQFGLEASSRKSLGGCKLLPIKNFGGNFGLGDLQCCRNVLVTFQNIDIILSRSSTDNSFDLMGWLLLRHAPSTVGPYIDSCVPFQIMSNLLNLPQVDSNHVVETSQEWSMETGWIILEMFLQLDCSPPVVNSID